MSNTKVKFYRGTHGMGICIELRYNNDRVIFDFGAPFEPFNEIYDGKIIRRQENRVKDALLLKKACAIDGLYLKDDLQDLDLVQYEDSNLNTAILICHLHLDHMSEMDKVAPEIPVYISKQGLQLNSLIEKIEDQKIYRTYSYFEYNKSFNVGEIKVTPYFSDHSCCGSSSFMFETPDATVIYTGDIRYHGTNKEKAFASIEEMAKKDVDLLIIDSTASSPSEFEYDETLINEYKKPSKDILKGCVLEQDLYDSIYESMKEFDGVGVFNISLRDTNMLLNFCKIGQLLKRDIVFEPAYAYVLLKLFGIHTKVIEPINNLNLPYIEELRTSCNFISIDDIKNNPNRYFLQNSYANILDLISLEGIKGNYYHYFGDPLVKGTKEYQIMLNFLEKLNWELHTSINLYSFSHSYPNHLAWVINTINPKYVVGVHSKHPENINPCNSQQLLLEDNDEIEIVDGKFIKV